jgi:hypothetical protein
MFLRQSQKGNKDSTQLGRVEDQRQTLKREERLSLHFVDLRCPPPSTSRHPFPLGHRTLVFLMMRPQLLHQAQRWGNLSRLSCARNFMATTCRPAEVELTIGLSSKALSCIRTMSDESPKSRWQESVDRRYFNPSWYQSHNLMASLT